MENKILVVEDALEYQKLIQFSLGYKYQIDFACTIAEARHLLANSSYQLIVLDVVLPDGTGFELCREIRAENKNQDLPIIFLTGKTSTSDKVLGFSIGADDYVVKPFDTAELMARVDLRILKSLKKKHFDENFKRGPLRFDLSGLRLYVEDAATEKKIEVTPIEFKILLKLAQNTNQVFSRQQLLDSVWGQNIFIDDRSIDKHISSIRKKIVPHQKFIKTISGIGYEFKLI